MLREQLLSKDEFLSLASKTPVASPDTAIADLARNAGHFISLVDWPNAATIARSGWMKLQAKQTVTPEQLEANYIRRSDAEIFAKPISNS